MAIIFYSKTCEGCSGNHALMKAKSLCSKHKIEFQERRTILWEVYEKEANEIMEETGVSLPFFYNTETGEALEGDPFTSTNKINQLIKTELDDGQRA